MQKQNSNKHILAEQMQRYRDIFTSKGIKLIASILAIILYFVLNAIIILFSTFQQQSTTIMGIRIPTTTLVAISSQLQMITSVFIVIILRKVGYLLDCSLIGVSFISAIIGFTKGNQSTIQGMFTHLCTIILISIVYSYLHINEKKYAEVLEQREEILALYEEISASESTLIEQKNQLQEMNGILEEREEELNQLAFYDSLTGLPNRRMIIDRLDVMLQIGHKENRKFAIIFADLDNFKKINDSAGHLVGDEVLQVVAKRWKQILHTGDILGRMGGDEFAILIQRPLNQEEIRAYTETFRNALNTRILCKQREFFVKASMGVSMFPQDGDTSDLLLKYADAAMYEAKSKKVNEICFFNRELQEQFQYNVLLENYLHQVLVRKELSVVFQPQMSSEDGGLRGFEALARWTTKKMGPIPPKDFIPIAEETGMIISMGEWILRSACTQCKEWMDESQSTFILSVNVSAVQIVDVGFVAMVDRVLKETGFDPQCLEFEVTESMFISSMDYAVDALSEIKKKGIKIALDDFGTGYASLSYLQSLPIDVIKIDKTFIDGIEEDRQQVVVKALVDISHELSLKVIAEGVEKQEQLAILKEVNCDYVQGYLLSKPLDPERARLEVFK